MTIKKWYAAALLLMVSTPGVAAQGPSPVAGRWEGAVSVPSIELAVVVDLDTTKDGTWIGDIDIPQQQARDVPLTGITVAAGSVTFEISLGPATARFEGKVSEDGNTMTGTMSQGGVGYPFTLKRTGKARVVVVAKSAELPARFVGRWEGTLNTPAGSVRLVFLLGNSDGAGRGTVDSPDQGTSGLVLSDIVVTGDSLSARLRVAAAAFTGKLGEDGKTITGEWAQGGLTLPLVLKKVP